MATEIVSIDRMVTIATNVEPVVKDVFLASARIITQLAIQSETMKPVANVCQILVSIALTTTMEVAVIREFVIVVCWKNQFGVVLVGNVPALANTMLLVKKGGNLENILR
jgi:hypothetical protein